MPEPSNTQRSPEHPTPGRSCLSEDEVLDFARGRLNQRQIDAVHAHLDRCAACQRLVGDAVREKSGDVVPESGGSEPITTFRTGDVVAQRYRVQRFIARGGMGEVYDVYDRDLQERVALKTVISTASDGQRAVRRLKAEVQLAHRVSHPNVCRIYDLGSHGLESGSAVHFLTMEFVAGERLGERIARGRLPVDEAIGIARQLLLGLRAAHAAGILHRDLKSDNVMLRTDSNGAVTPVILDFGLARTIDIDAARLTSGVDGFVGTPCYMAPEQLESGELSTATDVYAFGVIWFEMLTGKLPFSLRAPFERLSKRPARPSSSCGDVPPSIDKIVLRCLERLPEDRYASADEVLEALDSLGERDRTSRAVASHSVRPSRALGALALVLGGTALVAFNHSKTGKPPRAPIVAVSRSPAMLEPATETVNLAKSSAEPATRAAPPMDEPPPATPELAQKQTAARWGAKPAGASPHDPRAPLPSPTAGLVSPGLRGPARASRASAAAAAAMGTAEPSAGPEPVSPASRAQPSPAAFGFANPFEQKSP